MTWNWRCLMTSVGHHLTSHLGTRMTRKAIENKQQYILIYLQSWAELKWKVLKSFKSEWQLACKVKRYWLRAWKREASFLFEHKVGVASGHCKEVTRSREHCHCTNLEIKITVIIFLLYLSFILLGYNQ